MVIGGSPESTAGGIKTVTLGVVILGIIAFIKGKNEIEIFRRSISADIFKRANVIVLITIFVIIVSTMSLIITESTAIEDMYTANIANLITFSFMDIIFEIVSALSTVGLTLNVTPNLSIVGKFIVMFLMLIGRLGPITMSIALFKKERKNDKKSAALYPKEDLIIG